ncbi:MAG: 2-oxoacid:acceptor oxidoreductase family protein [Candidatus Omnitrophota bacterium]|nr:2-oxoacid:acceptor oxidoreductase family protein [Candidatus Omnitrophota bacterium]
MNILKLFRRHKAKQLKFPPALESYEVVFSGSGGQGIILGGRIFAEAASIYDNKEAIMTQSYGPEARGGASRAEVIISPAKIDYPKVRRADVLLAMTQAALNAYGNMLGENGLLIVDEILVKDVPRRFKNVFKAPFSTLASKLLDNPIVLNIIALGSLAAITNAVSREALIRATLDHVPRKVLVLDRIAVDVGFKAVEDSGFKWLKGQQK